MYHFLILSFSLFCFKDEFCELKEKTSDGDKEMVLKNRSHVATQTSLTEDDEPIKRLDEQVYSSNLDEPNTEEQIEINKGLNVADIEIIDNESNKSD